MAETQQTENLAWKKFRKNPLAMGGMIVILSALILSVVGYLIVPDDSTNANRMIVEIGGQSPGFTTDFLIINSGKAQPVSIFRKIISGEPQQQRYIPIVGYEVVGDTVYANRYIDEGVTEELRVANSDSEIKRKTFWLGTDKYGRDMLSRLIIGVRVSISVGLIAVIISLSLGVLLGLTAGYLGGRVDAFIVWFMNVVWSIPTLLLVFAITLVLGKGFWQVFIAVGLTMWVNVARLVRGQVMAAKELEYVEAARALGYSNMRIMFRHILPNIAGPIVVLAAANFASAIVLEAGLSFLGVGVQAPQPSWGLMIRENYNFIITNQPFLALVPGIAIMILVLSFNMVGNGLKDALQRR